MLVFDGSTHLFTTNNLTRLHNKQILKCLNIPFTHCNAEQNNNISPSSSEYNQLELVVLLYPRKKVMLTSNLWIVVGLINGLLVKIVSIFCKETLAPPQLPIFVVVNFYKYVGPPWDPNNPNYLLISFIKRGNHTQIPLKMAWSLIIHKSQGMKSQKARIEIGFIEHQGLTFTVIFRVLSLQDFCILPAFSFD